MLPTDPKERKDIPIFSGVLMYFPLALAEVAKVSKAGNDKHNGEGTPLKWTRPISSDHLDSAARHIIDAGPDGTCVGKDGMHLANAIWRLCAKLQLVCEARDAAVMSPVYRCNEYLKGINHTGWCMFCQATDHCEHCK